MDAKKLVKQLDVDFELDKREEGDWGEFDLGSYAVEGIGKKPKGLILDNAESITKVYTAVFPSEKVLHRILDSKEDDILLFTHHPMVWDPSPDRKPFRNFSHELLSPLKERRVSYYAIHIPLDAVGPYSTGVSFARAIGVQPGRYFFEYGGVDVGVVGTIDLTELSELAERVRKAVGHDVKVWNYGSDVITDSLVAVVGGGGCEPEIASEVADMGLNTYVTGITGVLETYPPSAQFHEVCKENEINAIGATHYSSEKFACIAMVDYFKKLGVPAEFIEDDPVMSDMD
ncbi:MAG: Nif3-like dinuclear metal center hexameric protein [Candidatus Thorarchaeota archaeon]|jgi:putative NIF3 family GTP cyclohydrolase 1 type 2